MRGTLLKSSKFTYNELLDQTVEKLISWGEETAFTFAYNIVGVERLKFYSLQYLEVYVKEQPVGIE